MHLTPENPKQSKETSSSKGVSHALVVFFGFSTLFTAFFSPILFSEKLLAPGDGIVYYIPALYSAKTLWTDLIFGGYPIAADPQNQTWYPLSFLFNSSPQLWNAYVVIAYVLAASFSYCYMYIVTRSRLAAIATGIVYSMSGYMMAHLGHLTMIHAAAWIPLILCAFEVLRHRFDRKWFGIGAGAIACCFLSGHPQIPVYGIGMGAIYATCLGWTAPVGRWSYYKVALGMLVIGLGISALQILPTLELSRLSLRAEMTFQSFSAFSLPPWQALQLIFPYLFLKFDASGQHTHYWGEWGGLTEIASYTGLLSLMLGAVGFIAYRSRSLAWFWLIAGVVTLLFTFGDGTPLGYVLYHIPVYKMFRAQGRHAVEVALAVSILAGLGVAAIQQHMASKRLVLTTICIGIGVMLGSLSVMRLQYQQFAEKAAKILSTPLNLSPWANPTVGVPILIFLAAALVLLFWSQATQSNWRSLALISLLVIDLASFGWFYEWRVGSPANSWITPPAFSQTYQKTLQADHQRLLAPDGANALNPETISPNLSRLWNMPSIGGYTPLAISRVSEMLQMSASGSVPRFPPKVGDRSLDLMAVRYVFVPPPVMEQRQNAFWGDNLSLAVGNSSCAPQADKSIKLNIAVLPNETTDLGFVTNLRCGSSIPDQTAVLQVQITDANGKIENQSLQAGRDTSELAYDCPNIRPLVKHQQATIFQAFPPTKQEIGSCSRHTYLSQIKLKHPATIKHLALKWTGGSGALNIFHINFTNQNKQTAAAFKRGGLSLDLTDSSQWKYIENIGQTAIYENLRAMPRAWLVSEAINFKKKAAVLKTIRSSRLPDGRTFEPERTALLEKGGRSVKYADLQPTDLVKVDKISDTEVELQTETASEAFLVLSDVYYPGWKATVDDKSTRIFRTNYLQRGIRIPKGSHTIKFKFQPTSFRLGTGISTASLFVCGFLMLPKNLLQKMRLTRRV